MFYLLKGTNDRQETGDVIIDKSKIEAFTFFKWITEKEIFWQLKVHMNSHDHWIANFNKEEEATQELRNLGISEEIITNLLPIVRDDVKEREENCKKMMERLLA